MTPSELTDQTTDEMPPDDPGTGLAWMELLAGPVVWIVHFAAVYLAAEAVCAAEDGGDLRVPGPDALVTAIVLATVGAVVGIAWSTVRSWRLSRRRGADTFVSSAAMLLGIGSIIAVLAVGLPALVIEPC